MKPAGTLVLSTILLGVVTYGGLLALRPDPTAENEKITIRFVHYQLESGLRDAFTAVAEAYERQHPNVRIEPIAVPDRIFASWLRVQLVANQAPDLVQLGNGVINEEVLARYFVPLTDEVARPNPYQRGTELETLAWRDTFADGLQTRPSFNPALNEVYGVPSALLTVRVFYNVNLWRRIFGETPPPRDHAELLQACARAAQFRNESGQPIIPFGVSRQTAAPVLNRIFESQTQRLMLALPGNEAALSVGRERETLLGALTGSWSLDTPSVRSGFELVRRTAQTFPPGFLELGREQVLMNFVQGRTLMMLTGVWEAPSLRALAGFPLAAFVLPLPAADDPEFGRHSLGPLSEASNNTQGVFGLTTQGPHPDVALDFLRFLTGRDGSALFTARSGWPAALINSRPPAGDEVFAPVLEGYPGGLQNVFNLQASAEAVPRLVSTQLHALVSPRGSLEQFISALRPQFAHACIDDGFRSARLWRQATTRQDTILFALQELGRSDGAAARKAIALWGSQTQFDSNAARYAWEARRARLRLARGEQIDGSLP